MRHISVSTEVFSFIWTLRRPGEETEDSVLSRVLRDLISDCRVEDLPQKVNPPEVVPELTPSGSEKGDFGLQQVGVGASSRIHAHSAWWQVVEAALDNLGGEAQLFYIYREVEKLCGGVGKKIPATLDATVRGTLEDNCAESHRYKGVRDVFAMPQGKGKGIWAIKHARS